MHIRKASNAAAEAISSKPGWAAALRAVCFVAARSCAIEHTSLAASRIPSRQAGARPRRALHQPARVIVDGNARVRERLGRAPEPVASNGPAMEKLVVPRHEVNNADSAADFRNRQHSDCVARTTRSE